MEHNKNIDELLNNLPDLVQMKILDYYLIAHGKEHKIKWKKSSYRKKDFFSYCLIGEKLNNRGYVKLAPPDLGLIQANFPGISLNPNINSDYLNSMILNCWKQLYRIDELKIWPGTLPTSRNLILAGGFFTKYGNNEYTNAFVEYYRYFNFHQDQDIYFNGYMQTTSNYNKYYVKIFGYSQLFNLIIGHNYKSIDVVDDFDIDYCNFFVY